MIDMLFHKVSTLRFCTVFPPAEPGEIAAAGNYLVSRGLAAVPAEYAEFLQLSDGMSFDGVEFYGTAPQQRKHYVFPDLKTAAEPYCKYEYFKNKIVIGRLSESIILYNANEDIYALIDRVNLRSRVEWASFEELFRYMMKISYVEP